MHIYVSRGIYGLDNFLSISINIGIKVYYLYSLSDLFLCSFVPFIKPLSSIVEKITKMPTQTTNTHVTNWLAFISGGIFSIGLMVSQMVNPDKVLNFLRISDMTLWDPSLMLVMAAALCVYWLGYFILKPAFALQQAPKFAQHYDLPAQADWRSSILDKKLIGGAILFGLGWGLTGLCPGPTLANLAGGELPILFFLTAMVAGMRLTARS